MDKKKIASLVRAAAADDRYAFEELYAEYKDRLTGYVTKQSGASDAEDIVSETFLTAMEKLPELKNPEAFGSWLYSIAYNKCMQHYRDSSHTEQVEDIEQLCETVMLPEDYAVNAQTREQLRGMINSLPRRSRSAVMLYYYDEKSVSEVASSLGVKESAARKLLLRAREKLKAGIEKLAAGGAVFSAVPMGAVFEAAFDSSPASAAGAAVKSSLAVKLAAAGAIGAVAVGVPLAVSSIGGSYRPVEVPDTVISRTENSSVTEGQQHGLEDLEFDTVANAVSLASAVLGNKYQNLTLPQEIHLPEADKAYIISVDNNASQEELWQQYRKLCEPLLGAVPEAEYDERSQAVEVAGEQAGGRGGYVDPSMFFLFDEMPFRIRDEEYESRGLERDVLTAVYDLQGDDISGVSYKVSGEDYPLSEAVKLAESYYRDNLSFYISTGEEVSPYKAYVFECPNAGGNYYYYITLRSRADGIMLARGGHIADLIKPESLPDDDTETPMMMPSEFRLCIGIPGKVSEVQNSYRMAEAGRTELDKIITLKSALAHAEDVLAPNSVYNVSDITLEYCGVCREGEKNRFELHPMWSLILKEYSESSWSMLEKEQVLCIDAVNGDVMLWDDLSQSFVFGDNVE